jgi:hypothetical protein
MLSRWTLELLGLKGMVYCPCPRFEKSNEILYVFGQIWDPEISYGMKASIFIPFLLSPNPCFVLFSKFFSIQQWTG